TPCVAIASLRVEPRSRHDQLHAQPAASESHALLDRLAGLTMRLLGDGVSRREAWRIARELELADSLPAELIAVARLQADVLVTDDEELRRLTPGQVEVVGWAELAAALA